MDLACGEGEEGEIELGFVCGEHDGSVGVANRDGCERRAEVEDGCGYGAEVGGATSVGNGRR